jgi:beta-1,4-mannosyl-glycoprotein beta-1,4-N-acetylglucosaminyltransferase
MVYDCFVFYNEIDLLEIRLNELNEVVDYFVLVEGEKTFQGKDKILFYDENKDNQNLVKFKDRIIHLKVPSSEFISEKEGCRLFSLANESMSFNYIRHGLHNAKDDDIIIVGPLDEIPKASTIKKLMDGGSFNSPKFFWISVHYYFFDTLFKHAIQYYPNGRDWIGSLITPKRSLHQDIYQQFDSRNPLYQTLTSEGKPPPNGDIIEDGGWHFSFIGDSEFIVNKLNSFAHMEWNHLTEEEIEDFIVNLSDPTGQKPGAPFYGYEKLENLPVYIQQNMDRFGKYFRKKY